jgi:hypothetical protein
MKAPVITVLHPTMGSVNLRLGQNLAVTDFPKGFTALIVPSQLYVRILDSEGRALQISHSDDGNSGGVLVPQPVSPFWANHVYSIWVYKCAQ